MRNSKNKKRQRGSITVEFAIVIPIFLILFAGTIDICNSIFLKQSLKISAYEATRAAIVPDSEEYDVVTRAEEIALARHVKDISVEIIPADFTNLPAGSFISVEVSVPSNQASFFSMLTSSQPLQRVTMMKEY